MDAKARLVAQGKTYAQWADEHGFPRKTVYAVLKGRRPCRSGVSHQIAVALGVKPAGEAASDQRLQGVRR